MAVTTNLARGTTFYVDTGGGTWVQVLGVSNVSHTASASDADTTTFDSAGRKTHLKASRGDAFTISGFALEDPDNGDRDAGQEAVEAWAQQIGPDSVQAFRVVSPGGVVREFDGTATVNLGGGGNDAPNAWSATVTVTGAIDNSGAIAVLSAPTSVSGSNASGFTLVSFTQSGTATEYEVVIYSGSDEVKRVRSSAKPVHVVLSSGSYTAKARSRNAGGWSALSSASSTITTS